MDVKLQNNEGFNLIRGVETYNVMDDKKCIINTTYANLKTLRDNSQLVPGKKYRITDYNCTTTQPNTQSAGNRFDIIVTALSENILSEEASATNAFSGSVLILYKTNMEEYPGAVDYDEPCHYVSTFEYDGNIYYLWRKWEIPSGETEPVETDRYYLSDTLYEPGSLSLSNYAPIQYTLQIEDGNIEYEMPMDNLNDKFVECVGGSPDPYFVNSKLEAWKLWYCLDNDTNRFAWADSTNGKGVIYRMIDEYNNDVPYDFKNIQFKRKLSNGNYDPNNGTDTWVYTFNGYDLNEGGIYDLSVIVAEGLKNDEGGDCNCQSNSLGFCHDTVNEGILSGLVYGNTYVLGNTVFLNLITNYSSKYSESWYSCSFNTFGNDCCNNTFGSSCRSNTFGDICYDNTFGDNFVDNTFGYECYANTFGDECHANTFGYYCDHNSLGTGCYYNTFGSSCDHNTFGNSCSRNTFGEHCYTNTFGNNCTYNTFGNSCYSNTFGDYCSFNTFDNGFRSNTFVEYCSNNTFGAVCHHNTFGSCTDSTFGNYCNYIKFGDSSSTKFFYRYIIVENGNQYIYLNCTATTSPASCYQNVTISQGVNNTSTYKTITDSNVGQAYQTKVAVNTNGVMKIYCEADLIQ